MCPRRCAGPFTLRKYLYLSSNQQIPAQFAFSPLFACSCGGMSTERQRQASRANGSKSHGPTTPAGKLASSRNAITHGMLSTTIVLNGESTDRFLELLTALLDEFQPQTPFEESLIENMTVARWRQMRIWGMEKAAMEHEMRRQGEIANSTALDPAERAATRAAIAFRTLSDDSRSIELINRYESRFDRQYLRAHRRFLDVRDRRTPPTAQRSAPPDHQGTSPTGGAVAQPPATPQPETKIPNPEKAIIAKRTPQVAANKPRLPGIRVTARRYNRDYGRAYERRRTQRPAPRDNRNYNPISDWRALVNNR